MKDIRHYVSKATSGEKEGRGSHRTKVHSETLSSYPFPRKSRASSLYSEAASMSHLYTFGQVVANIPSAPMLKIISDLKEAGATSTTCLLCVEDHASLAAGSKLAIALPTSHLNSGNC
eukprot:3999446-Amphidinium_carterae.1